jgi:superfamily II DNA or RNA helicase
MVSNDIEAWMAEEGYRLHEILGPTRIYSHKKERRLILIDRNICDAADMPYGEYTNMQNRLMHHHEKLYRFAVDSDQDLDETKSNFRDLVFNESGLELDTKTRLHGADRSARNPDPTPIEYFFEEAFIDLYGRYSLDSVLREASFPDIYGSERFYDYLIQIRDKEKDSRNFYWIAIEQNGEQYHHPAIVGKQKYKAQLIKQNSFVSYGNKLYRWSFGGMIDKDNFIQDLKRYLGSGKDFLTTSFVKATRDITFFQHQETVLEEIQNARSNNKNSFLIVLPTGTGKTNILIEDLTSQYHRNPGFKTLILVPTKTLQDQTFQKIKISKLDKINTVPLIEVRTYLWISIHYREYPQDHFRYIAVDEAHHAMAPSLKRVIQYFTPETMIGMTATDKRLDTKKLEDVFGSYETHLTLKEAILKGILSPIRAFRIKSNLDLSQIRFNGKDYMQSDLQRHIFIESRDQLVADVLQKYFSKGDMKKQGVVFCVNVRHAESLAKRLTEQGIPTKAVSGKEKQSKNNLEAYARQEIQFLTSCSLIHEGWDSPQTSVIVMARPTMSKVLYTQQIGRGTRKHPGKEALYIIDVVDNYDSNKSPWSIHALMNTAYYKPWADILDRNGTYNPPNGEELILSGFFEAERKIEKIDIFTFEKEYGDYLSVEQFARELFVSTGTIKNWIKKGVIKPDVIIPFGRTQIEYFAPSRVDEIQKEKGLQIHNESTIYKDFFEFLEKGDYTFSYKMVFLLAFFALTDNAGNCRLDQLTDLYKSFYLHRLENGKPVDRKQCPYTNEYLSDNAAVQRSILSNPFEKFERKRFMFHVSSDGEDSQSDPKHRDLNFISFSHVLWERISPRNERQRIIEKMQKDLELYYQDLGGATNFSFAARYGVKNIAAEETEFIAAEKAGYNE